MNQVVDGTVRVSVEGIGGISSTQLTLDEGVTLLVGRNATNRTSFLQGVMAALGSDGASLKADSDEGSVELDVGGDTYTRRLDRRDGTVSMDGDPYLDDPTLADLFAFLLKSNDARRAVVASRDLREVIMRPVDTASIESQIRQLERERDDLDATLEELESLSRRLPDLEEERVQLDGQIEETRAELEAKETEIGEVEGALGGTREERAELEAKLDELRTVRGDLKDTRGRIDSELESIEALADELDEVETALGDVPAVSDDRNEGIDDEIQRLREQTRAVESTISDLQSIIQFNRESLEEGRPGAVDALDVGEGGAGESVTEQLVDASDETVCWTCGTTVQKRQIETTLDMLRDLHREKTDVRHSLGQEIDDLRDERNELERRRREREELEGKLERVEDEIDERRDRLTELEDRRDRLSETVERLEDEVTTVESEDYGEVIELHKEANQLEFELDRLEGELDDVEDEIERIEGRLDERDAIESRREERQARVNDLRTRIEDLERAAVEEFNGRMEDVLELLDYENLERIWIERTEQTVRGGRETDTGGRYDLHVVRSTADGAVYEDTIDHLSESEREVTGLVFALAGYLVHEVYEEVPFMLLDSVEALDSDRIALLVEYLQDFPGYLLVALLPEDAAAFGEDVPRITDF